MSPIVTTATVGPDGTLTLTLPPEAAGRYVRVSILPYGLKEPMTQEEWAAKALATAGTIPDPTFMRHPEGDHQERDPL